MSTKFKTMVAVAAALLLTVGVVYRVTNSSRGGRATELPAASGAAPANLEAAATKTKLRDARDFSKGGAALTDPALAAAFESIRAALRAPGRVELYPQPEMKKALLELREHYREAVPLLREALRDPDWEARRRAAGGLAYLSIAATDAIPDLIQNLRAAPTLNDAVQAAAALQSIGVGKDSMPDLVKALDENPKASELIEIHFPGFIKAAAQRGMEAADGGLLDRTVANLTAEGDDARLNALMGLAGLGPGAIDAIPALKEYIRQPNREDLKMYAEKLLDEIDPDFQREKDDPAAQEAQAERARQFSERARAGQASVRELISALRELPQAIPAAAKALGSIGYDEMGRRAHESPEGMQEFMDANIMLTQIAASNQPLETRLAASDAFGKLQPMREKLLYTAEDTAPAFEVITNALPRLAGGAREQIESRLGNMIDSARLQWTALHRPGEVTDYQGAFLVSYANELAKLDQRTYDEFVAAMRKRDPKFLQKR